jgi:hypothetical protein
MAISFACQDKKSSSGVPARNPTVNERIQGLILTDVHRRNWAIQLAALRKVQHARIRAAFTQVNAIVLSAASSPAASVAASPSSRRTWPAASTSA